MCEIYCAVGIATAKRWIFFLQRIFRVAYVASVLRDYLGCLPTRKFLLPSQQANHSGGVN